MAKVKAVYVPDQVEFVKLGKIYDAIFEKEDMFRIVDEDGDTLWCCIEEDGYGIIWSVVSDDIETSCAGVRVGKNGNVYIPSEEIAMLPEVQEMQKLAEEIVQNNHSEAYRSGFRIWYTHLVNGKNGEQPLNPYNIVRETFQYRDWYNGQQAAATEFYSSVEGGNVVQTNDISVADNINQFNITLRDYFAAKAMSALMNSIQISSGNEYSGWTKDDFAKEAYGQAAAMLKARENE